MTYDQQPEEPAANVVREKIETDHDGHFLITVRCPVCKMPLVCRMRGKGHGVPVRVFTGEGRGEAVREVTSKASGAANDVWARLTNNLHNASTNAVYYGLAMKLKDPRVAEGPEWFLGSLDEDERMVVVSLVGASMLELQARAIEVIGRHSN